MKIIGLYGWSGSGKTDLICRLLKKFSTFLNVSTIKHTHHNVTIDKEDKDSFKHKVSGAKEIMIWGGHNWALIHNGNDNENIVLDDLCNKFSKETDLLIIEGLKDGNFPKIEVYNSKLKREIICKKNSSTIALVYDKIDKKISDINLPILEFSETEKISDFIINFLKIKK